MIYFDLSNTKCGPLSEKTHFSSSKKTADTQTKDERNEFDLLIFHLVLRLLLRKTPVTKGLPRICLWGNFVNRGTTETDRRHVKRTETLMVCFDSW